LLLEGNGPHDQGCERDPFAKFLREFLRAVRGALPVGECRTAVSHAKRHL